MDPARFICDAAVRIDKVEAVGPTCVGLFGRVAELVNHSGNLDPKFSHARPTDQGALFFIFRAGEDDFVFDIALHLPHVARMRFRDVDDQERTVAAVLLVKVVEGGILPPERRSRIAAENQHDRWLLVPHWKLHCHSCRPCSRAKSGAGSPTCSFPARACIQAASNGNMRNGTGPGIFAMTRPKVSGGR